MFPPRRSGAWINRYLRDYDLQEEDAANSTITTAMTSGTETPINKTKLPEYYDTDDYDMVKKAPMHRCKGRGLPEPGVDGSSSIFHNQVVIDEVVSPAAFITEDPLDENIDDPSSDAAAAAAAAAATAAIAAAADSAAKPIQAATVSAATAADPVRTAAVAFISIYYSYYDYRCDQLLIP